MKFRMRFILILLILVNSMGYDWLHTLWHFHNGTRVYQSAVAGTDMLSRDSDDRLVDTSQPGNTDLSPSEIGSVSMIFLTRISEPSQVPVVKNGLSGFPFSVFKPPRLAVLFV